MSHLVWACAVNAASAAAATKILFTGWISPIGRAILAQLLQHHARQSERGGEPGRLDAEEVHQAGNAVPARSLALEVGRRRLRPRGLRTDAGIAWRKRRVRQAGPVAPDRRIEALGTLRVDVVGDAIDPFHVGAEARLTGEVERDVHAEAARLRHGIDQAR